MKYDEIHDQALAQSHQKTLRAVRKRLPQLSRLFDRWDCDALTVMFFLKIMQFFRVLGVRAKSNGWRKVCGTFLHSESSKFVLATFRLDYWGVTRDGSASEPRTLERSRRLLLQKLAAEVRREPSLNYSIEPGWYSVVSRKSRVCDLVAATLDENGLLMALEPFWDERISPVGDSERKDLNADVQIVLEQLVHFCNEHAQDESDRRAILLKKFIRRWTRREAGINYFRKRRLRYLARRVLRAGFVFFETLPDAAPERLARVRTSLPDFLHLRHPGWGVFSVLVRFTADLGEVDLWCQFHHVAVDGAPMQEWLSSIKRSWGCTGQMFYPAMGRHWGTRPEIRYCGEGTFRSQFFLDLQQVLEVRNELNARYQNAMAGKVSVAGILMWVLTRHRFFHHKKILLPVDAGVLQLDATGQSCGSDAVEKDAPVRNLQLLMIRPAEFERPGDTLAGFLAFQRAMNQEIVMLRNGEGATSEFLELCALMHPIVYHAVRFALPRALREIVGTVGVSVIRDAEMFVAPLTEFQINGFLALGALSLPTLDGRRVAAISVSGSRAQLRCYLEALVPAVRHLHELIGLREG